MKKTRVEFLKAFIADGETVKEIGDVIYSADPMGNFYMGTLSNSRQSHKFNIYDMKKEGIVKLDEINE